jgi:hypothetical protein
MCKYIVEPGRQATDDNMTHAHCMLDTLGYKQTVRICKTYRFSTGTGVAKNTSQCFVILVCTQSVVIPQVVMEPVSEW